MTTVFVFKGIKAKKLKQDVINKEIKKALEKEGKDQQKELNKTVQSWSGERPKFESLFEIGGGGASVLTGPTGSDKAVNKFLWLDQGTRVRWALMSSDWQSKTSPGSFSSGRGRGRPVLVGKQAMRRRGIAARPGIAARGWTTELAKRRKTPFQRSMIKAMQTGAKKLF